MVDTESMATRSGHLELDSLLDQFEENPEIQRLRERAYAHGRCDDISHQLVDFLHDRDLDQPWHEAYVSGDEWENGEMLLERICPEDFGYDDRPIEGCNSHILVMVDIHNERFSVDYTAAQYGYSEFPLIQRLLEVDGEDCWRRDFVVGECDPRGLNGARLRQSGLAV